MSNDGFTKGPIRRLSTSWKALCEKCRHEITRQDGPRTFAWYNHFCGVSPLTKGSPQYVLSDKNHFCRDINDDGACKLYEATHEQ